MTPSPEFLDVEDVIHLHGRELERFGGADGIRDLAALVFLEWNGHEAKDPGMRLYDAMIAIAERRLDKKGLAVLIKELATAEGRA